jgi:hypothetical protein
MDESKKIVERIPEGTKRPLQKALTILVSDNVITDDDRKEIIKLIDYRNIIAHQSYNLFIDMSTNEYAKLLVEHQSDKLPKYNYEAIERIKHFQRKITECYRTHSYVWNIDVDWMLFSSAEKTFKAEINRLDRKILRLKEIRAKDIKRVNAELSLVGQGFDEDMNPRHWLNKQNNGQLSERGVEICYRLFDLGKSSIAVAHLIGLSVVAVRKRRQMWTKLGGVARPKVEFSTTRPPKFYSGNTGD